jgi:hypothetical protein
MGSLACEDGVWFSMPRLEAAAIAAEAWAAVGLFAEELTAACASEGFSPGPREAPLCLGGVEAIGWDV